MSRLRIFALVGATIVAGVAVAATPRPSALSDTVPGLWEIAGVPGAKPVRECVGDVTMLARFEHRRGSCTHKVLTDGPTAASVDYTCTRGGFGRSKLTVITPRSLKIETQGISDNQPFNYVLTARRVGECESSTTAARH